MKLTLKNRLLVLALLVCLALPLFGQGVYWEATSSGMGMERKQQMYYLPKMFKGVTNSEQGSDVMIVRLDKSTMYQVTPSDKSYSEMSFAELEGASKKMGSEMDARMAEMKKRMESMPPEQRAMAEQMMSRLAPGGQGAAAAPQVEKTGETKTISGFNCTKYVVKQGDKEQATVWATQDVKEFAGMKEDFREFSKKMLAANPMAKGMSEIYQKIEGFPVQTEMGQGMKTTVTKIERRSVAASEFEIPSDYKKIKSKLREGMEKMDEKK